MDSINTKIVLSADTPCDIGSALTQRYHVQLFPLHILLEGKQYTDGEDISMEQICDAWWKRKALPSTAAVNPEEYATHFQRFVDRGCKVLHISLGSGLSSTYQNAQLAAASLPGVYVIDSKSLSTGYGLLVCEAGERIAKGMEAEQIYQEVSELADYTRASFVLDTLEFMRAGGRCSTIAYYSANIMQLKPCIEVRQSMGGAMTVGKKYTGKIGRVMLKYVEDQLKDRDDIVLDRIFITSCYTAPELIEPVKRRVLELQPFKEVFCTTASCTIGAHCGPNTLGVLYIVKH